MDLASSGVAKDCNYNRTGVIVHDAPHLGGIVFEKEREPKR